ncbi:DUF3987 domain-containing protein [Spirosoma sp. HMF4905]|uniref:DUF3987 domain-containing protein n=1 Tax=Spirosoma arboris TaxID=2682092 RepID=A0A7K1SHG6_9BACT|nr:DUF3987 domain-containing protein [Spirosoma arboris]MVM33250.1 DUF3987 domain-containing protein [Spirosoma arboris]
MSTRQPKSDTSLNGLSMNELQQKLKEEAQLFQSTTDQPTVNSFPTEVLPTPLQKLINQTEMYSQFRPEWIGSSILYAASVAVGNSIGTKYKGWAQKATLYLALVGLPGTNKSSPAEEAIKPLRQLNSESNRLFNQQMEEYKRWEKLSKKQRQLEGLPLLMIPPAYKTLLVSDVTPEALIQTHQNNPFGLGLFMDELAGWFQNFNRYSKGSDQEFWLSNWSFSPISVIRKTSAPIQIDTPFISILGTIQPGILNELAKDGRNQNGFIDRILFAYPDNQLKPYDREGEPDSAVLEDYKQCIMKLYGLRQESKLSDNGNPETRWLPFSPEAFEQMKIWKNRNTDRGNQTENLTLKGIYAKLDAYCIRFALLLELLDWAFDLSDLTRIRSSTVNRAIQLVEYFRQNTEKVHFVLTEQTAIDRLPKEQIRLFNALPDEISTKEAAAIADKLIPPISSRTVKRLLNTPDVFKRVGHGEYRKCD